MTTDTEIIEGEIVSREVVPAQQAVSLWHTDEPSEVVEKATKTAKALADVIRQQKLAVNIQGREYVTAEGYTLLGSMLGVFPVNVWTRELADNRGWEARVEAHRGDQVIGAAEAMCTREETRWKSADDYAIRSMAQTRATAKALRMPLGFVMKLAGYAPTPLEEMDGVKPDGAEAPSGPRGGEERPAIKTEDGREIPVRAPSCKQHGPMRFIKSGTSKAGKAYGAFWGCTERTCKVTADDADWRATLLAQATKSEPYDVHDVPTE